MPAKLGEQGPSYAPLDVAWVKRYVGMCTKNLFPRRKREGGEDKAHTQAAELEGIGPG